MMMKRLKKSKNLAIGVTLVIFIASSVTAFAAYHAFTVGRQQDGSVVVATKQVLTPAGHQLELPGRPVAVAFSPDGKTAALLTQSGAGSKAYSPGVHPITVIELPSGRVIQQFDSGNLNPSTGILYSQDGRHLYASEQDGKLLITDVASDGTLSNATHITLPQTNGNPYPSGLALSKDGKILCIALSRNNSLGVFDLEKQTLESEIPVGNAPHSIVISGNVAYVSNEGGRRAQPGDFTEDSSGTPIVADPKTGAATSGTVSVVDLTTQKVTRNVDVGLHPTGLCLYNGTLFVANTNSDTVSAIDTGTDKIVKSIDMHPYPDAPWGSSPNALSMMPDGRLVVSLAGNNALGIYDWNGPSRPVSFEGLVPTGWFPGDVGIDRVNHRLVVPNVRGVGDLGPLVTRTSPTVSATSHYIHSDLGSVSLIPFPQREDMKRYTSEVVKDNGWDQLDPQELHKDSVRPQPIPLHTGEPSTIKHVFYIIKENNTYDSILGDDPRGNGDPSLAEMGGNMTPNHHALARQFPLLDNTYTSGENSALGHQWTDQAYAPDYLEKAFSKFPRSYPSNGGDSMAYTPGGFLWEDALAHGLTVRDYGEYANQLTGPWNVFGNWSSWYHDSQVLEGKISGPLNHPLGQFQTHSNVPSNEPLLNHDFPMFSTTIPDQYRADIFLKEFATYVTDGNLPNLVMMALPNDHSAGWATGEPTPESMFADNDLALGRIVDAISHSPYWKDSAIFVVEDDTQNDVDHVDGARTTAFAISPYAKHNFVDSTFYTQIDMVRTIEQILGIPPMNQLDTAATPMRNAFTDKPDFTPYNVISNKIPLDDLNPSPNSRAAWTTSNTAELEKAWIEWSTKSFGGKTSEQDQSDPNVLNHAKWYSAKGFNTPYPGDETVLLPDQVTRTNAAQKDQ